MLPALLLAAACAAWHADATGFYRGEVESIGPKPIDTWIEDGPAGLVGHYVLHEPDRDVPGTLEPLGDARLRSRPLPMDRPLRHRHRPPPFLPDRHCFEGSWGADQPLDRLPWHSCAQSRVTS